ADVVDGEAGGGVVVLDGAEPAGVADGGLGGGSGIAAGGVVVLVDDVAVDVERDGLGRLTSQEGKRASVAGVVARLLGAAVGGGVVHCGRVLGGPGLGHGEGAGVGAGVALQVADVVDGEAGLRVVVLDGAEPAAVADGGLGG